MTDYVSMAFELETERLVLRPWSVTDAEWYRQLLAERNVPAPELDKVRDFLAGAQEGQRPVASPRSPSYASRRATRSGPAGWLLAAPP